MTKPLGYFTNLIPGDDTLLNQLEREYGPTLEKLTRRQKLYLITAISADLGCQCEAGDKSLGQVSQIPVQVHDQLSMTDAEGLLEALIAQVRYGQPGS